MFPMAARARPTTYWLTWRRSLNGEVGRGGCGWVRREKREKKGCVRKKVNLWEEEGESQGEKWWKGGRGVGEEEEEGEGRGGRGGRAKRAKERTRRKKVVCRLWREWVGVGKRTFSESWWRAWGLPDVRRAASWGRGSQRACRSTTKKRSISNSPFAQSASRSPTNSRRSACKCSSHASQTLLFGMRYEYRHIPWRQSLALLRPFSPHESP